MGHVDGRRPGPLSLDESQIPGVREMPFRREPNSEPLRGMVGVRSSGSVIPSRAVVTGFETTLLIHQSSQGESPVNKRSDRACVSGPGCLLCLKTSPLYHRAKLPPGEEFKPCDSCELSREGL